MKAKDYNNDPVSAGDKFLGTDENGKTKNFTPESVAEYVGNNLPSGDVVQDQIVDGVVDKAPSQNAVYDALQGKQDNLGFTPEDVSNKSTDIPTDQASDVKYPSVKAVYDWVIAQIGSLSNLLPLNNTWTGTNRFNKQVKIVSDGTNSPLVVRDSTDTSTMLEINSTNGDVLIKDGIGKIEAQTNAKGYWPSGVIAFRSILKTRPIIMKGQTFMGWGAYEDADNSNYNIGLPAFSPAVNGNANGAVGGEFSLVNDTSGASTSQLVLGYRIRSGGTGLTEKTAEITFDSSVNDAPNEKYYGTSIIFKTTDAYVGGGLPPILEAMRINHKQQVIIGGTTPDPTAVFQVGSTTKGILIPRMTTTQRNAITTPATSLLLFNTTTNQYEFFNGTAWVGLGGGGGAYLPLTGGTLTGDLTVGDNIINANNIVGNNLDIQVNGLFITTPSTTFVFPMTDGTANQVLKTDGTGSLSFATIDKTYVGLGNVDNTSDLNKPISTATQTALDLKQNKPTLTTVQTTNNTPTVVATIPIPNDTSKGIRFRMKGRSTTGLAYESLCYFAVNNVAGTLSLIGTMTQDRKNQFTNSVQNSITFSGANAQINITGQTGLTINWECYNLEVL